MPVNGRSNFFAGYPNPTPIREDEALDSTPHLGHPGEAIRSAQSSLARSECGAKFPVSNGTSQEYVIPSITIGAQMKYGFLHIGKTGGSSVNSLIRSIAKNGSSELERYGHRLTLKKIFADPDARVSFVIRDPIERFVSAFNSRLRCGRRHPDDKNPSYYSPWRESEAITFSFFKSAAELAESLYGEDERLLSAAQYAVEAISHLRRNYRYHLHSVNFLRKNQDRIYYVCDINDLDANIINIVMPSGVSEDFVRSEFKHVHSASGGSRTVMSDRAVQNLRRFLSNEFEIYDYCRSELCRLAY